MDPPFVAHVPTIGRCSRALELSPVSCRFRPPDLSVTDR
jgi:hypothetical protein